MKSPAFLAVCIFLAGSLACDRKQVLNEQATGIYTKACQEALNLEKQVIEGEEKDPAARQSYVDAVKTDFETKLSKFEREGRSGKAVGYSMALDLLEMERKYEERLKNYEAVNANPRLDPAQKFPPACAQTTTRIISVLARSRAELDKVLPPIKERLTTPQ